MSGHQKKHPLEFKTQYGLGIDPQDEEIVVDFFCGDTPSPPIAALAQANGPWRAAAQEAAAA